jgi:chromosome condensin MukBEF MukE localization factor
MAGSKSCGTKDMCNQDSRIKRILADNEEQEKRLHEGDLKIQALETTLNENNELLTRIHNRMFIDNGKESYQTTMTKLSERQILIGKVLCFIVISLAGIAFAIIKEKVMEAPERVEAKVTEEQKRILQIVSRIPEESPYGLFTSDIAPEIGKSEAATRKHLNKLSEMGIIKKDGHPGYRTRYKIIKPVEEVVE